MLSFAKQAPFSLQEIQKASPSLLTVAEDVDELNALMEITGDIASSSVLDFQQVAQQLQKTFSGGISAADQFRDSGVKALLGFETGVKYTAEASKKHIMKLWSESTTSMKGATKDMAQTFEGQVSMMGDAWDELQLAFMKEGVFDETKSSVQEITEWLRDPDTLQGAKDLAKSTLEVGQALKESIGHFNDLPEWVKTVGIIGAVFGGKVGKAAITGLMIAGEEVNDFLDGIKASWDDYIQNRNKDVFGEPPPRPQLDGTPAGFEKIDLAQPKPIMIDLITQGEDNAAKALKSTIKLSSATNKYKTSIANVGIELTKRQKLESEYMTEADRIRTYVKDKVLSSSVEANAINEVTDAYTSAIKRMDELDISKKVQALTDSMTSSITDMVMNIGQGTQSLKESVKDMARVIIAEFVKIKVAQPAANWLASSFNFSDIFNPKEHGGTVTGNRPYMVGEAGPELFLPNKTGTIIPNDALSTGGSTSGETNVSVSFNITANDTTGFDDLLDSRRGMIVGIINQAMNDRGMTGVTA